MDSMLAVLFGIGVVAVLVQLFTIAEYAIDRLRRKP